MLKDIMMKARVLSSNNVLNYIRGIKKEILIQTMICIVGLGHVGYSLFKLNTQKYDCDSSSDNKGNLLPHTLKKKSMSITATGENLCAMILRK